MAPCGIQASISQTCMRRRADKASLFGDLPSRVTVVLVIQGKPSSFLRQTTGRTSSLLEYLSHLQYRVLQSMYYKGEPYELSTPGGLYLQTYSVATPLSSHF